jgi:hypothetical protein
MMRSIQSRIEKLASAKRNVWSDVITQIRAGKTYAQLSEEQKDRYCMYHRVSRNAVETVCRMVCRDQDPDFPLELVVTPKEENERVRAIAAQIEESIFKSKKGAKPNGDAKKS